jgi:hypothetical protein
LQFKPLIAGNFLGSSQLKLNNEQFFAVVNQKFGYSFGANVRIGLTKLISLETGIDELIKTIPLIKMSNPYFNVLK